MDTKKCPNCDFCPLFVLMENDRLEAFWKDLYCHADYSHCERYKSFAEGMPPPREMLPNGSMMKKR